MTEKPSRTSRFELVDGPLPPTSAPTDPATAGRLRPLRSPSALVVLVSAAVLVLVPSFATESLFTETSYVLVSSGAARSAAATAARDRRAAARRPRSNRLGGHAAATARATCISLVPIPP